MLKARLANAVYLYAHAKQHVSDFVQHSEHIAGRSTRNRDEFHLAIFSLFDLFDHLKYIASNYNYCFPEAGSGIP